MFVRFRYVAKSEDAEWIDEGVDDVDTTGLDIPSPARSSGLPVVQNDEQLLPWD